MDAAQEAQRREAFRHAVANVLERRLFYTPSFEIYGGVAGLYDYGPPGTKVKANVLAFWRQHFVDEEDMLEIDSPCVTSEDVLKASGHVDKFTDLNVKDLKTGKCYRADHLLKKFCTEKLEKDSKLTEEKADELRRVLAMLDDFSSEELGAKIKEYGITAPDTNNSLSDPYPFNLMFPTSIGPYGSRTVANEDGDEPLNVFRFPPLVAPIKCTVFPLIQNQQFEEVADSIAKSLKAAGISTKIVKKGISIGKRYARTDELGVPFAITVDSATSVTVRERDSKQQIRVKVDKVASLIKELTDGVTTWPDVLSRSRRMQGCCSLFKYFANYLKYIFQ